MAEFKPSHNKLNPELCEVASIEGGAHPYHVLDFVDTRDRLGGLLENDYDTVVVALRQPIDYQSDVPMGAVVQLVEFMARLGTADETEVYEINDRLVIRAWWDLGTNTLDDIKRLQMAPPFE
jgi:hypothetical protein